MKTKLRMKISWVSWFLLIFHFSYVWVVVTLHASLKMMNWTMCQGGGFWVIFSWFQKCCEGFNYLKFQNAILKSRVFYSYMFDFIGVRSWFLLVGLLLCYLFFLCFLFMFVSIVSSMLWFYYVFSVLSLLCDLTLIKMFKKHCKVAKRPKNYFPKGVCQAPW